MINKVAIPIWQGHVSPVMDTACRLLIVEIKDSREVSRAIVELPRTLTSHRAEFVSKLGINLLICGALSQPLSQMLTASGIKTMPWFRGDVNEVLAAYLGGRLQNDSFQLPGCQRRRQEKGRRSGRRNGWRTHKSSKED